MAPVGKVSKKKVTADIAVKKNPKLFKSKASKPKLIQKKNAKHAIKKTIQDLSESDFDSDDDLGMNGPEFGPLSGSESDDNYELDDGNVEQAEGSGDDSADNDEDESNADEDETDQNASSAEEEENAEGSEDESSSEMEIPEPEGSVEGDTSEDETPKEKKPKFDPEVEKRTIFVGNLPSSVKKMKLKKWFSKFGKIETVRLRCPPIANPDVPKKVAAMQKDFHAERTNISAFVRFVDLESAKKALEANGSKWGDSHHIRVDTAAASKAHDDKKAIFLGNMPFDAEENQVRDIFVDCGDIESIRIIRDRKTNVGKGFAYVNFAERHSVQLALEKNGELIGSRKIRVERCNYKRPTDSGRALSKNYLTERKNFLSKNVDSKKKKKSGEDKPSFQGIQAKRRQKRMNKKKTQKKNQKESFVEVLNSKTKKPKKKST